MKYQRLPIEVDPFRLVEQGRELIGRLPVTDFPRLRDLLFFEKDTDEIEAEQSVVEVELVFDRSETGLPIIKGFIRCELDLHCQRCLKGVATPFESLLSVVLVSSDTQAESLQEGYDTWLVEDSRLFLQDFIEDEILLALPIVTSHEQCEPARELIEALPEDMVNAGSQDTEALENEQKENPFAVLKNLKLKQ